MIDTIIKMLIVGTAAIVTLALVVIPIAMIICTGDWRALFMLVFAPISCAFLLMAIEM